MRPITLSLTILAAGVALLTPAIVAANWLEVASEGGERVEIDLARIARVADGKTVAWNRLILGKAARNGDHGRYDAVEALNRYDCQNRRFATVKRVYLLSDKTVGEESVPTPKELGVVRGGVDDRLLAEACKLRSVGEMKQIADTVDKASTAPQAAAAEEAKPMYADMRTAGDKAKAPATVVADAGVKASESAAPESGTASEKPAAPLLPKRLIELPKIDKSQLDRPKEAKPAPAPDKIKPVDRTSAKEREKQYATSGPRRAVKKKVAPSEHPRTEAAHHGPAHWGYVGEGAPANWAKLSPDFGTCATGKRQSPIDIRDGVHVDLEPIAFDYKETRFRIIDNGHTIQASVGDGSSISVMGRQYQLVQLHFHRPAEERVDGRGFDMVVHLVHRDIENRLAVIAVPIEQGADNPVIQALWNNLPLEVDLELAPREVIDLNRLLPENRAYMTYMGSLTTPPCTEGVLWMVFKHPIQISSEQLAIFARIYPNNARPLQPANGRLIKESR